MERAATAKSPGILALLATALLAAGLIPSSARSGDAGVAGEEILVALREKIVAGYHERSAEKILSLYDGEARIATFTRGVLDKEAFAALLRETFAQSVTTEAALEVGAVGFDGDTALVPVRLILTSTDGGGQSRVTADRCYLRLRKRDGWKIQVQTYRRDFTLPPDNSAPGLHH